MTHQKKIILFILGIFLSISAFSQTKEGNGYDLLPQYILKTKNAQSFCIANNKYAADIYVDNTDWTGVIRAANDLAEDVNRVTGTTPKRINDIKTGKKSILIGTIGKSRIIDGLIANKKLDVTSVRGKWESFIIQTVGDNLVIAGSDKRGTIYGIYDVSEKIGVSPWYWWADVPAKKSESLYLKNGKYVQDSPKVKYRGIFINDEHPSFAGWAGKKFGDVNSKMYVHMFELLLRLKANYLWPAMWANAFNEDDPQNPILADEYGIVMGTSHHEPMMRAHKEYTKRRQEIGPWDYASNKANLDKFFTEGLERNKKFDNIITIGMRGDGDSPMGKGDDNENIKVLQNVIDGERKIIKDVYGKNPAEIPQLWAIFTEVQRYYDAGFTVPDDVTLLFCDNNWGQIRRTGPKNELKRKGGMGLYYHIDMNGGPWNDRWVNTTTVPKLREQLNLAYQTGLDRIWIINVGDLKPKEMPIDFIMRYAWNPDAIPANKTDDYMVEWAKQIFGEKYAAEVADIVSKYSKYNVMRKAEVQYPRIFSYVNYNEADSMLSLWHNIVSKAEVLNSKLPQNLRDAYYQLVLYPTKASAGVAEMYISAGKNNLYAKQGRPIANDYANRARSLFELDKKLSDYYNDSISNGNWKIMMSDNHIGYQNWAMPKENKLPDMTEVKLLDAPAIGVAVEGSESAWPGAKQTAELPVFDVLSNRQKYYIDVFNKGVASFDFKVKANKPWIKLNQESGVVSKEVRLYVSVDWNKITDGTNEGTVEIIKGNEIIPIKVKADKYARPQLKEPYFGGLGEFSIPASEFNANVAGKNAKWIKFDGLGRNSGTMGIFPVTAPSTPEMNGPRLEYKIFLPKDGNLTACFGILPTQDINPARGFRIAVSIDDQKPEIIDARKGMIDTFKEYTPENIARSKNIKALPLVNKNIALIAKEQPRRNDIFDFMRWVDVDFNFFKAGVHTIKVYMVDPEIVLDQIVVNPDNRYPSYWGAPVNRHN